MTAMEKVAWTELFVSVVAVIVASALYPWLGCACGVRRTWLSRMRFVVHETTGQKVVVDERDRTIERRATQLGVEAAWITTFLALIGIVFWTSYFNEGLVATRLLTWLIWVQFAICYGVKGCVGVVTYRRQSRAS